MDSPNQNNQSNIEMGGLPPQEKDAPPNYYDQYSPQHPQHPHSIENQQYSVAKSPLPSEEQYHHPQQQYYPQQFPPQDFPQQHHPQHQPQHHPQFQQEQQYHPQFQQQQQYHPQFQQQQQQQQQYHPQQQQQYHQQQQQYYHQHPPQQQQQQHPQHQYQQPGTPVYAQPTPNTPAYNPNMMPHNNTTPNQVTLPVGAEVVDENGVKWKQLGKNHGWVYNNWLADIKLSKSDEQGYSFVSIYAQNDWRRFFWSSNNLKNGQQYQPHTEPNEPYYAYDWALTSKARSRIIGKVANVSPEVQGMINTMKSTPFPTQGDEANVLYGKMCEVVGQGNILPPPDWLDKKQQKRWLKTGPNALIYFLYKTPKYKKKMQEILDANPICEYCCPTNYKGRLNNARCHPVSFWICCPFTICVPYACAALSGTCGCPSSCLSSPDVSTGPCGCSFVDIRLPATETTCCVPAERILRKSIIADAAATGLYFQPDCYTNPFCCWCCTPGYTSKYNNFYDYYWRKRYGRYRSIKPTHDPHRSDNKMLVMWAEAIEGSNGGLKYFAKDNPPYFTHSSRDTPQQYLPMLAEWKSGQPFNDVVMVHNKEWGRAIKVQLNGEIFQAMRME